MALTKEKLEELIPPIPLSRVGEGVAKAEAWGKSYEPRVNPRVPDDYDNSTSEAVYAHLKGVSEAKEVRLQNAD